MGNQFSNEHMMNQVNLYFDKALNKAQESDLMHQIHQNPEYNRIFQCEQRNRTLLKDRVTSRPVPNNFVQTIMDNLKH